MMDEQQANDHRTRDIDPVSGTRGDGNKDASVRRRRIRKLLPWLLLLLLVAAVAVWFRASSSRNPSDEAESGAQPVVSVVVAKVARQDIAEQASALGTIFPREQSTVSAKVGGQIAHMVLLKNHVVHAGEVIATLEARDLQAQRSEAAATLQEARATGRALSSGTIPQTSAQDEKALRDARANLANASNIYQRRLALYQSGGISRKDLDSSQLAVTTAQSDLELAERTMNLHVKASGPNDRAAAEARVNEAQDRLAALDAQLSYATIRAPITGIITDQFQFHGEYAASGAKLVNIADISEVIVKANFPDTVAARLKTGDAATVFPTDMPGEQMPGAISLVSSASDPVNRTIEVWCRLGNGAGRLLPGSTARLMVTVKEDRNAVVVPASTVTLDASNSETGTVMVVDGSNVAHSRKVTTGIRQGGNIEITSGLNGGETIVAQGNYALPDGSKVEPSSAGAEGDQQQGGGAGSDEGRGASSPEGTSE